MRYSINFPDDYFKEEVRDDFLVDENRKKTWACLLDLYSELKRVCDKYGITVYATAGTLLGAIRHGGFIPWDDDLDVALTREGFTKLCEIAETEFKFPYFFQYALSDRAYFKGIARLRRTDTTGIITFMSDYVYNNGVLLDIYIYDKAPTESKLVQKNLKEINFYSKLLQNYYHSPKRYAPESAVKKLGRRILRSMISYENLYKKYLKCVTKNRDCDSNRYLFLCNPNFIKYEATVNGYESYEYKKFEFLEIAVPSDYEYELTHAYGDYMQFPPVEQRGKWHDNTILFNPDIPFIEYMHRNPQKYKDVLSEYDGRYEKS